jgi:ElaA protein
MTSAPAVHASSLADLDPATLYRILRLRMDVFVVEQACAYAELDGRDLEPTARQLWIADAAGEIAATLRLLRDGNGEARIGRVATAASARGHGLAAELMRHALELVAGSPVVLDAQAHLLDWYARFGFVRDGDDYIEDGIPHVAMRLRIQSEA